MKILVVTPRLPYPPDTGGKSAVFNLIKSLSLVGHDISLLSLVEDTKKLAQASELGEYCRVIPVVKNTRTSLRKILLNLFSPLPYTLSKYYFPGMKRRFIDLLEETQFDIVQIDFLHMAFCAIPATNKIPVVLRAHNVESIIWERLSKQRRGIMRLLLQHQWKKVRNYESRIVSRFDLCLVFTKHDERRLKLLNPAVKTAILPAGVDISYFKPQAVQEKPNSLIFVGDLLWTPNVDGIWWFVQEVFPLIKKEIPEITLHIVGRGGERTLKKVRARGIDVTGYVRDVRPHIRSSSVYVVPLRAGGGIRIKVLEALAMRKAIVSTTVGCEGIDVESGRDIFIADSPEMFAEATIELLRNSALREELGRNGRRLIERKYTWDRISPRLIDTYSTLLSRYKHTSIH